MSQVISDPQRLIDFANALRTFWQNTEGKNTLLKAQLSQLQETWQDQQYDLFQNQFSKAMQVFVRFKGIAEQEEIFLRRSAEELQRYERERLNIG